MLGATPPRAPFAAKRRPPVAFGRTDPAAACGALCIAATLPATLALHAHLLKTLEKLLQGFARQVGILASYQPAAAAAPYRYHVVCGWLHRAGRHPFRVNLALCAATPLGAGDLQLQPERHAFREPREADIDPRCRAAAFAPLLRLAARGMLQHETEDEWAAALLQDLAPAGAGVEELDIRLRMVAVQSRPRFDTFVVRRPTPEPPADAWATPEASETISGSAVRPGRPTPPLPETGAGLGAPAGPGGPAVRTRPPPAAGISDVTGGPCPAGSGRRGSRGFLPERRAGDQAPSQGRG